MNNFRIINRIKEVLEEKGKKQICLADKLGKSYNMFNAYVQNRHQHRIAVFTENAKILEVDIKDLIVSTSRNNG